MTFLVFCLLLIVLLGLALYVAVALLVSIFMSALRVLLR